MDQVWTRVVEGVWDTGDRLPTVRQLAIDLGVHPDTVVRAYDELEALGVIIRRRGEGTFVGIRPSRTAEVERRRKLEEIVDELADRAFALGCDIDDVLDTLAALRDRRHPDKRSDQ